MLMYSKVDGSSTKRVVDSGFSNTVRNFDTNMKTKYIVALIVLPIIISIVIVTSICLLSKIEKNPSAEIITREYSFPNKKVFLYDYFSFENGRFVYLVCDEGTSYKCKLYQEIYPFENTIRYCNISLIVDGMVHNDTFVLVKSFGENRTILIWEDSKIEEGSGTSVRISIVHLNECRKTTDLVVKDSRPKFDDHTELILRQMKLDLKLVTYNDTFDIFFSDSKRCGDKECQLSISDEGKVIGALHGFTDNTENLIRLIEPIALHSPDKGYIFSLSSSEGIELTLIRPDGSSKHLTSFGFDYSFSVVNETIGVCFNTNDQLSSITCLQFNASGDLKLNISYEPIVLPHSDGSKIHSRVELIYTLPDEGFVITSSQFVGCRSRFSCGTPALVGYSIEKLEANGEKSVNHYIQHYDEDWESHTREVRQLWKSEQTNAYCAILLRHSQEFDSFNLTSTCYEGIF